MNSKKYIGMDVHKATISVAVRDAAGKLTMESIIETKAATVLAFIHGIGGSLSVAFEEGTGAGWLYDLLKPHVGEVIVCDPRKNALLRGGSKNDKIDARKLSELLRVGLIFPVYHGEQGCRRLKEFARSYCREPQTSGLCAFTPDSLVRTDSGWVDDRVHPDTAPLSDKTPALGLRRSSTGDSSKWRIPLRQRRSSALRKTIHSPWAQQ